MKRIMYIIIFVLLVLGCMWAAAQDVPAVYVDDYPLHIENKPMWDIKYDKDSGILSIYCAVSYPCEAWSAKQIDYLLVLHRRIAELQERQDKVIPVIKEASEGEAMTDQFICGVCAAVGVWAWSFMWYQLGIHERGDKEQKEHDDE